MISNVTYNLDNLNLTMVSKLVVGKHMDLTKGIDESIKELDRLKGEMKTEREKQEAQKHQSWAINSTYAFGTTGIVVMALILVAVAWKCGFF